MAVFNGALPRIKRISTLPFSDIGRIPIPNSQAVDPDPKVGGGMFALRLDNGQRVWQTPAPPCDQRKRCSPAQSAAVTAIPGIAFSGSVDGHLRAYSTADGKIMWDFDTVRTYETVNKINSARRFSEWSRSCYCGRDTGGQLGIHREWNTRQRPACVFAGREVSSQRS